MSSYCPNSAHPSSAVCRSARRSRTSRQVSYAAAVRCASVIPRRHRCYGRERRGCSGHATPSVRSATSEYSRQADGHISRIEGLLSVAEYRPTVAGRPIAPLPRATADIGDPAVSQQRSWAGIHPQPHLTLDSRQRVKKEASRPLQWVYSLGPCTLRQGPISSLTEVPLKQLQRSGRSTSMIATYAPVMGYHLDMSHIHCDDRPPPQCLPTCTSTNTSGYEDRRGSETTTEHPPNTYSAAITHKQIFA